MIIILFNLIARYLRRLGAKLIDAYYIYEYLKYTYLLLGFEIELVLVTLPGSEFVASLY